MSDAAERILVVEDDTSTRRALVFALEDEGARVWGAATGSAALKTARSVRPDAVLLDLGLPDMPGVEVLRDLRTFSTAAVIVVSASSDEAGKIAALDAGADDYVTKPYSGPELYARVRAQVRRVRGGVAKDAVLQLGEIRIDLVRREVTRAGKAVSLTRTEFALLEHFARRVGQVCSHDELLEEVWGPDESAGGRERLWTYIRRLRQAIEPEPKSPRYLVRRHGRGYSLVVPED